MILLDSRDGNPKDLGASIQMVSTIRRMGVPCDRARIEYGDVCFEGHGPTGIILIGMERKTIHDMLHCIDDARYNMQRLGMREMYAKSFLLIEGRWKCHDESGMLMADYGNGSWSYCKYRSKPVMFAKLHNYLLSVAHSGVIITYPQDLTQTCAHVVQCFNYHQKKWTDHTSLLEKQVLNIPTLHGAPTLTRRWAAELEGVGVKYSQEAERLFKRPIKLATSDEMDWLKIDGIGVATAQKIVKEIGGYR